MYQILFYRPFGYLYDKQIILENLLHQKRESNNLKSNIFNFIDVNRFQEAKGV